MARHLHVGHHEPPGAVAVLDIAGDVGALVVYVDGPTPTGELEIRPAGEPEGRFHTGVHPRALGGTQVHVALFPEVHQGLHEILDDRLEPVATVDVTGGGVTELDLRVGRTTGGPGSD